MPKLSIVEKASYDAVAVNKTDYDRLLSKEASYDALVSAQPGNDNSRTFVGMIVPYS